MISCKEENPSIFIAGCPFQLARLFASEANDVFIDVSGMSIKNILIGVFYLFDKSSKRKGKLSKYLYLTNSFENIPVYGRSQNKIYRKYIYLYFCPYFV